MAQSDPERSFPANRLIRRSQVRALVRDPVLRVVDQQFAVTAPRVGRRDNPVNLYRGVLPNEALCPVVTFLLCIGH